MSPRSIAANGQLGCGKNVHAIRYVTNPNDRSRASVVDLAAGTADVQRSLAWVPVGCERVESKARVGDRTRSPPRHRPPHLSAKEATPPPEQTFEEAMQTVKDWISEINNVYRRHRECDESYYGLHEAVYFRYGQKYNITLFDCSVVRASQGKLYFTDLN